MHERSAAGKVQGTWNDSSRERKFHGTNGPGNECSKERIVLRTKVPGNEWSRERKFHHGNECSRERIVLGTNIPDTPYSGSDNSSGRSAIYRLPTRKLLAVDRIFIYGFMSLISVVTGNGNPLHFNSIFPVGKLTASYLLTPLKPLFYSRVPLTSSVVPASRLL